MTEKLEALYKKVKAAEDEFAAAMMEEAGIPHRVCRGGVMVFGLCEDCYPFVSVGQARRLFIHCSNLGVEGTIAKERARMDMEVALDMM